jgi:gluconolactonase
MLILEQVLTADDIALLALQENSTNAAPFQVYNSGFNDIIGSCPNLTLLIENASTPLFHEAAVYLDNLPEPTIFVVSNQFNITNSTSTNNKDIVISKITQSSNGTWSQEIITPSGPDAIILPNGGFKYQDGIVFAAQGSLTSNGALVYMNASYPYNTRTLIDNYFSRPFNSLNDVFVTSDGALWFTDPPYGYTQGIRPAPQLPAQVYRFDPVSGSIRVVADGLQRPNGITFSPDEQTAYLTDGAGDATSDFTDPRTVYAYDVQTISDQPFLTNKRVFALPQVGIPDGIKTDTQGNVYAGCGDGVSVWNSGGVLLGKILVSGGSSNFVLGKGEVFLLNEKKFWGATVAGDVVGATV